MIHHDYHKILYVLLLTMPLAEARNKHLRATEGVFLLSRGGLSSQPALIGPRPLESWLPRV